MRRVVVALGTAALLALVLAVGRDAGRATSRGARDGDRTASARVTGHLAEPGDPGTHNAGPAWSLAALRPGEIALRVLDVEAHRPVRNLEVAIKRWCPEEERPARTDEEGIAAWEGIAPGRLEVLFPDRRYGTVADKRHEFYVELASQPVTVWVERVTTLRLRFAHDDGTPVGAVWDKVADEEDRDFSELNHGEGDVPHHDWYVSTGSTVTLRAKCEDGYEVETALTCDSWPLHERTIHLRPAAPRGRTRVRFEVVAEESGEPIADAGVGYFYRFGPLRWWERVTDKEGTSVLEDLPTAGSAEVSVWAHGRRYASEVVKLEPGSPRTLRFALARASGPSIRGTCPDRPNAKIRLENEGGRRVRSTEPSQGEFVFDDLEPGDYEVIACDGDDTVRVTAAAGGPPLLLSFPALGTLVLDCRDADGRVPESIDVALEREGAQGLRNSLTPEGGRFRLAVSQGPVGVSVSAAGYRRMPAVPLHVIGDVVNEAKIPLGHPLPILDVLVVDPAGTPVPGVTVSATRKAPTSNELDLFAPSPALYFFRGERTSLHGWVRLIRDIADAEEVEVAIGGTPEAKADDGSPDPFRQAVRVPTTGRVTATFVVVPRPMVRPKAVVANEAGIAREVPLPEPLLDGDELIEWDGWPLRLAEEVPQRWTAPVFVKFLRDGKELTATLPPMRRTFRVVQALHPPR